MFTPLHIYTSYSFLKSGFTVAHLIASLKEKQYDQAAISDYQVLFGLPEFFEAAEKHALFALAGLDVTINDELITLIAMNEEGYRHLVAISSALARGEMSPAFVKDHNGGLIAVISTRQGKLMDLFVHDQPAIPTILASFDKLFTKFYLGIEIYDDNDRDFANHIRDVAAQYNYETMAFPFIKYPKAADAIVLTITHAIAHDETIEIREENGPYYLPDQSEVAAWYTEEEIALTTTIANKADFTFGQKRGAMLVYPVPSGTDASLTLREMTIDGLQKRNIDFTNIAYLERLDYELRMIEDMGYNDYFLIVADYVRHAREQGIPVGPGRGSAPGSLVSFSLFITDVDPIKYSLLFERFLNPARKTMPDIDIDFADIRREEVIDYLRNKYGEERVANIITFQTIQAKQAIRDIGRVYQFSPRTIEAMAKALPDSKLDIRTAFKRIPAFKKVVVEDKECLEIVKLATRIEGLIRQSGMHPAGIILNETPIAASLPVLYANGHLITQYEMDYLENQGFLKMDLLGLRNLTIVDDCLKLIAQNGGPALTMNAIPYDDPKIYELVRAGLTMGIFQLESDGMRKAIKEIQPSSFDDIVVLLAIFRPGPMDNIASYALRKQGKENATILDTQLNDILMPTYGIIIYQEQIMQIAERMAGFSLAEADLFRRAVAKKDAEKLGELQEHFVEGAIRKGYSRGHAVSVFNHIYKFADYGFNKSHSVAYAVLACQMAYLKVYYPQEFFAAVLEMTSAISDDKFGQYLAEMTELKIGIVAPDVNHAGLVFDVQGKKLLVPLTAIRGISGDLVRRVIEERDQGPFTSFYDFIKRMYRHKITAKQLEHMIDAGAFDNLHKSRASLRASINNGLQNAAIHGKNGDTVTLVDTTFIPQAKMVSAPDDPIDNVDRELAVLGMVLSASPFKHKKQLLRNYRYIAIQEAKETSGQVTIAGIIRTLRTVKTKAGQPMAFLTIFDDTGDIEVVVFPRPYADVATQLARHRLLLLTGRHESEKGHNFIADKITVIEEHA